MHYYILFHLAELPTVESLHWQTVTRYLSFYSVPLTSLIPRLLPLGMRLLLAVTYEFLIKSRACVLLLTLFQEVNYVEFLAIVGTDSMTWFTWREVPHVSYTVNVTNSKSLPMALKIAWSIWQRILVSQNMYITSSFRCAKWLKKLFHCYCAAVLIQVARI